MAHFMSICQSYCGGSPCNYGPLSIFFSEFLPTGPAKGEIGPESSVRLVEQTCCTPETENNSSIEEVV